MIHSMAPDFSPPRLHQAVMRSATLQLLFLLLDAPAGREPPTVVHVLSPPDGTKPPWLEIRNQPSPLD